MSPFDTEQKQFWGEHTNLRPYDHPIVQAFARQRVTLIQEMLVGSRLQSALEVGCGDGFGMHYMQPLVSDLYGCDLSFVMLRNNPMRKDCLYQADAYRLPYGNRRFDLVYCWELLHHIHDPLQVLKDMARVSRQYVLVFEPNCLT